MLLQVFGLRASKRTMSESARLFALQITDILEEIVEHLAPGKECTSGDQQQDVSALTRVSKVFHIPATKALWARLPSLHPLLLLLPEYDRLYQAHCKDKPFNRLTSVVCLPMALSPVQLLTDNHRIASL